MTNTAHRLQSRRMQLGLGISQVAKKAKIPHSVVSRIENGEYQFSRHLFEIADVLEVNVDWLVRGREPMRVLVSEDSKLRPKNHGNFS